MKRVLIIPCITLLIALGSANAQPTRPHGVPSMAIWVGGQDGGVFIRLVALKDNEVPRQFEVWVYSDHSATLWYHGHMILKGAQTPAPNLKSSKSFDAWDGEELHLTDGRTLVKQSTPTRSPATNQ